MVSDDLPQQVLTRALAVRGAGGGSEVTDTLRSTQTADILDLISEGECEGLVNGLKSIYLDGVPLQAANGSFNFEGVTVATTPGNQGQAAITGSGVQNEIGVGVTVLAATPIVRTIANAAVDTCRVTILVPQLSFSNPDSGDLVGSSFEWAIEVQSNGGGYVEVFREVVTGKSMSRYARSTVFKLPGAAPWNIKVRRITADSASSLVVNAFAWSTYAEIQTLKLRYPNSCLVRTRVGAQQFARIPVRSFDWLGLRIQVPVNYNPKTRVYSGVWDGTFKIAWTDNPAWIYHDMVRSNRYGLGRYIAVTDAFKWEIYAIGQYCDGMVPDGRGGQEPRFRCSPGFETREQAYKVLTDLAAAFRGMAYWMNADVAVVQDAPGDSAASFSPANVIDGKFTYSGASNAKRYSSVVVWFNSLSEQGRLVPEVVVDRALTARYGVRPLELSPMGIWSRGQAQRLGKWVLYTQQYETEAVTFKVGLDGVLVSPGRVFQIADPNEAGERLGGRVRAATTTQVTLDADVVLAAGETYTLTVMLQEPANPAKLVTQLRAVSTPAGTVGVLSVAAPFTGVPAVESVWLLQSTAVEATNWRCIGLAEVAGENAFTITGVAHAAQKYALIELGIAFEPASISRIRVTPGPPTELRFTEAAYLAGSITRSRVTVSWVEAQRGSTYEVSWRLSNGPWTYLPAAGGNSMDIDSLTRGLLEVQVYARNALGNRSVPLRGSVTVVGKVAKPPDVQAFMAQVVQGGVRFTWLRNDDDDYLTTTLRIGTTIIFEGAVSSWTWAWPAPGTYTVTATHWDTSIGESAVPASVLLVVDNAMLVQWAGVSGRPALFRVVARGGADVGLNIAPNLFGGEAGAGLAGGGRSYAMARIRRADGVVVFNQVYDVYAAGADPGNPPGLGRGAAQLAADLNASGTDVVVVVWTYDEPQGLRLTAGLDAAMYRCGASRVVFGSSEFKYRSAYVLVGISGCGEGNGFEAYSGNVENDTNAWCDVAFTLLAGNLMITGAGSTPRTLADYSYSGTLDATTDLALVATAGIALRGNSATKIGASAWDAEVRSRDSFTGGAFASARPKQNTAYVMFGLNSDPLSDVSYASLDYAWYTDITGILNVYESGQGVSIGVPFSPDDVLAVVYDGARVYYLQNGIVRRTVATTAGRSFFFDSSFYSQGAVLSNMRFGPMSEVSDIDTGQLRAGAVTEFIVASGGSWGRSNFS